MKPSHQLFENYQHLVEIYSKKIILDKLPFMTIEDVKQDMRIKIYTSIQNYSKKWQAFVQTNRLKPVPLEFYLKAALNNHLKDLMKKNNRESHTISIGTSDSSGQSTEFDFGVAEDFQTRINPDKNEFVIDGVDLLSNLKRDQKVCFGLFLKGYTKPHIQRVMKQRLETKTTGLTVQQIIDKQIDYLKTNYKDKINVMKDKYEVLIYDND